MLFTVTFTNGFYIVYGNIKYENFKIMPRIHEFGFRAFLRELRNRISAGTNAKTNLLVANVFSDVGCCGLTCGFMKHAEIIAITELPEIALGVERLD